MIFLVICCFSAFVFVLCYSAKRKPKVKQSVSDKDPLLADPANEGSTIIHKPQNNEDANQQLEV